MMAGLPTVLVVDDDPHIRALLVEILEEEGLAVECAADGRTGLTRILAGSVDLVLLDLILPDLSGLDLLERLRSRPASRDLPVVVLSAVGNQHWRQACLKAGAVDYISKPFDLDRLLDRVRAHLACSEQLAQV